MAGLTIDRDRCNHCGFCVIDCPMQILEFQGGDKLPAYVADSEELCIDCGHCLAVCPEAALSLSGVSPDQCRPIDPDLELTPEAVAQFLQSRRSIRAFKRQPVERELLERAFDIARWAPSGHNTQPVNWLVISGPEKIHHLAELTADWMRWVIDKQTQLAEQLHLDRVIEVWESGHDRILRRAPHLAVAHAPKDERSAPPACNIALAYLELAAFGLGLGACWAGYFNAAANFFPPMVDELALPEGHVPFGALMLGHPKVKYHRLPPRREARITWR